MSAQLHTGTTTDGPRLEFAVCDTGIGVLRHLRQNPRYAHYTHDKHAIARATKAGVSGVRDDDRGNGLSDLIEDARQVGAVTLHIRSGKGEVRVLGTSVECRRVLTDLPDETVGTWAWLTHRLTAERESMVQSKK